MRVYMELVPTQIQVINVPVLLDLLGQIVNTLIVPIMDVRMAQPASMETLVTRANVLAVFLETIVKPLIIVTIKTATTMVNVSKMKNIIIHASVNRNIVVQTVSL